MDRTSFLFFLRTLNAAAVRRRSVRCRGTWHGGAHPTITRDEDFVVHPARIPPETTAGPKGLRTGEWKPFSKTYEKSKKNHKTRK